MQRKRGELVPIGEVVSGLDDVLVPAIPGIVTLIVLGRKSPHGFPFRRPHSHFPRH